MSDKHKIHISKIEAARCQLNTAIELWFMEKDTVSIHTLVYAAFQIIHDVNEHRGNNHESLYDTPFVREEYRKDWIRLVKQAPNFFKHADRDAETTIEVAPFGAIMFFLYAIHGLRFLIERSSPQERIFSIWLALHRPEFITDGYREYFSGLIPVENVSQLRRLSKPDLFQAMLKAAANSGQIS